MRMNDGNSDQKFGKIHAAHAGYLTRYLAECRRACDGDLDLFLVMAIIGERTFSERCAPEAMSIEAFVGGTVGRVEALPINLQSISEFTGIPRETVRRKLEILIQKGWIRRDDRKYMTATDKANLAFLSLTKITQKYLRDLASALNRSS